jgi:3-oxoacyl-[acyl-carrier protein] reductase
MARRGADVVVNARTNTGEAEAAAQEARDMGVRALALIADVGDEGQVSGMIETVVKEFGRIDILINNAGLRLSNTISEMTTDEWRRVLAVNLDGPFFLSRAVAPGMISSGWGRIINVAGLNAFRGRAEWAHVCASKMGAIGLTRSLALELAPHGILVNHVVPGAIDTVRGAGTSSAHSVAQMAPSIPVGRLGICDEIAKTCGFLVSDDAGYITGQTIHVNGGALTS